MEFSLDDSEVQMNFDKLSERLEAAIVMYGETAAKKLEAEAKRNRPWTDRTSRARIGLTGSSGMTEGSMEIVLAHTVDYGLWLELAHEKRFAIVEPTVRLNANRVWQGLKGLLGKVHL